MASPCHLVVAMVARGSGGDGEAGEGNEGLHGDEGGCQVDDLTSQPSVFIPNFASFNIAVT